jgi:hypothetical protein
MSVTYVLVNGHLYVCINIIFLSFLSVKKRIFVHITFTFMTEKVTNDGKKGGNLVGKPHNNKKGESVGGIKAVVTDTGQQVELEGGEVIINKAASKKHWKELSKINQSAGNGVAIGPPIDPHEADPDEYKKGGKIQFNANKLPNKWVVQYAKKIKKEYPEIWKKGGNIFGNEAFNNLLRVSERGYWLDSEKWMYIKWRAFVARHKKDFRIAGVVAMLKWCDKVEKGWSYMKDLIEAEIKKKDKKGWKTSKSERMSKGGSTKAKIKGKAYDTELDDADLTPSVEIAGYDEHWDDYIPTKKQAKKTAEMIAHDKSSLNLHDIKYRVKQEDANLPYILITKIDGELATVKKLQEKLDVKRFKHFEHGGSTKPNTILDADELKQFTEWIEDGNAFEKEKGVWVEQTTQYRKKFTKNELQKFFKREFFEHGGSTMKKGGVITYRDKYNKKYGFKKGTSHSLKDISKKTGIGMKGIQEIYNKGIGAYKTNPGSVRPSVKSKEQWAYGRVYSAVMSGKAADVDGKELKMNTGGEVYIDETVANNPMSNPQVGMGVIMSEDVGSPFPMVYYVLNINKNTDGSISTLRVGFKDNSYSFGIDFQDFMIGYVPATEKQGKFDKRFFDEGGKVMDVESKEEGGGVKGMKWNDIYEIYPSDKYYMARTQMQDWTDVVLTIKEKTGEKTSSGRDIYKDELVKIYKQGSDDLWYEQNDKGVSTYAEGGEISEEQIDEINELIAEFMRPINVDTEVWGFLKMARYDAETVNEKLEYISDARFKINVTDPMWQNLVGLQREIEEISSGSTYAEGGEIKTLKVGDIIKDEFGYELKVYQIDANKVHVQAPSGTTHTYYQKDFDDGIVNLFWSNKSYDKGGNIEDWKSFVLKNKSWFKSEDYDNKITLMTRDNSVCDGGDCSYGQKDLKEAEKIEKLVLQKYPDTDIQIQADDFEEYVVIHLEYDSYAKGGEIKDSNFDYHIETIKKAEDYLSLNGMESVGEIEKSVDNYLKDREIRPDDEKLITSLEFFKNRLGEKPNPKLTKLGKYLIKNKLAESKEQTYSNGGKMKFKKGHKNTQFLAGTSAKTGDLFHSKRHGLAIKVGDKLHLFYAWEGEPKLGKVFKTDKLHKHLGPATEDFINQYYPDSKKNWDTEPKQMVDYAASLTQSHYFDKGGYIVEYLDPRNGMQKIDFEDKTSAISFMKNHNSKMESNDFADDEHYAGLYSEDNGNSKLIISSYDSRRNSYDKGGSIEINEDGSNIPKELQEIFDDYNEDADPYKEAERLRVLANEIGYTFDYDLSGTPTEFQKLETGGKMDEKSKTKFYKTYYENVSPTYFKVETEDDKIVIDNINKTYPENFGPKDVKQYSVKQSMEEGGIISGKTLKQYIENTNYGNDLSFVEYINDNDKFDLKNIDINAQIQKDGTLKDYVNNSEDFKPNEKETDWLNKTPIIIGDNSYENYVVLDGYHRIKQAQANKEKTILAYVKASNYAEGGKTPEVKYECYVEYLDKDNGFKRTKMQFKSYRNAEKWCRENFEKFHPDMIGYNFKKGGKVYSPDGRKILYKDENVALQHNKVSDDYSLIDTKTGLFMDKGGYVPVSIQEGKDIVMCLKKCGERELYDWEGIWNPGDNYPTKIKPVSERSTQIIKEQLYGN